MRSRSSVMPITLLVVLGLASWSLADVPVPQSKQTVLGLYMTAQEAYEKWKADPEHIKILDCRTPEEFIFVGHAPMAHNVASKLLRYEGKAGEKKPVMSDNPDFVSEVKKRFTTTDTLLVMCRSGGRSAACVNKLAEAGFKKVYNIIDGFEGDEVDDPESYFHGKRLRNGWKNSGAPWTYDLDPKLMYIP